MKQNFKFMLACAAAIAMVGCAKDKPQTEETEFAEGTPTYATIRVSQNKATRAAETKDDKAPTETEDGLNDAQLLVFNGKGELESITALTELTGGDNTFATYTGPHTMFVLANVPASLGTTLATYVTLAEIKAGTAGPATTLTTFKNATLSLTNGQTDLATYTVSDDFYMTNVDDVEVTKDFVAPASAEDTTNDVVFTLGRAVAKVSMYIASPKVATNGSGSLGSVEYKVINNPEAMYVAKHFDGTVVKTPYHDLQGDTPIVENYYATTYVEAADDLDTPTTSIYIPENSNGVVVREGEISALMIKGIFAATEGSVQDKDGVVDEGYEGGDDLYRVFDVKRNKWLLQFYSESPTVATIKAALGLAYAAPNPTETTDYTIKPWTGGLCYYRLPLQNNYYGEADPMRYNVLRNDWFLVDIASVSDIGGNNEADVTPDPKKPVTIPINVNATIDVLNWNGVAQTGNL